ncbi:hypothetical protein CJD36_009195 [Flavipsychrobacter stenotrophus]|uniref:HTH cro/C1-type domain-containing protein n=1 Tax=Flavipsychrobacter stenotrophus TaxID=2077091 RepID=A0A2S7SZB4_9BACT|nr:helix-turn-helix transcriptional regulator [Flavipsychrobacter stenotrophus]PQJ11957.1 hypothetical protein CJD36_009195 [Flavipsychrobacter stenotrophus]
MDDGTKHTPPNQSRNIRLAAGFNQEDVAFLLNIKNIGRISQWENGIANPSIENLLKLSIVYGVLPDQLYYELRKKLVRDISERKKLLQEIKEKRQRDRGG